MNQVELDERIWKEVMYVKEVRGILLDVDQ